MLWKRSNCLFYILSCKVFGLTEFLFDSILKSSGLTQLSLIIFSSIFLSSGLSWIRFASIFLSLLRSFYCKFWNKKGSLFFGIKICNDRSFFASFYFVPISLTFFNFHTKQNEIQDTVYIFCPIFCMIVNPFFTQQC